MKLSGHMRVGILAITALAAAWAAGCSSDEEDEPSGAGGSGASAGRPATGGTANKGGTNAGAGKSSGGTGVGGNNTPGGATGVGGSVVAGGGTPGGGGASGSPNGGASPLGGAGGTANGGTSQAAGTAGVAGKPSSCGTTPASSSVAVTYSTFGATGAVKINDGGTLNKSATLTQITDATVGGGMCSGGCGLLTVPFASGDAAWGNGVVINPAEMATATNLVGAKIVAKIAIDDAATPIQFKIFAQGAVGTDLVWIEKGSTDYAGYALSGGVRTFEWAIADTTTSAGKQVCASAIKQIGMQVQTAAAITAANAGTVKVYIQSISIVPPGGQGGTGGAGGGGGSAGAPSSTTTSAAGAGTAGTTSVAAGGSGGSAGSPASTTSVEMAGSAGAEVTPAVAGSAGAG